MGQPVEVRVFSTAPRTRLWPGFLFLALGEMTKVCAFWALVLQPSKWIFSPGYRIWKTARTKGDPIIYKRQIALCD